MQSRHHDVDRYLPQPRPCQTQTRGENNAAEARPSTVDAADFIIGKEYSTNPKPSLYLNPKISTKFLHLAV
jgi:hypothetical protein